MTSSISQFYFLFPIFLFRKIKDGAQLQQNEQKQATFARPKYTCTAGYHL